MGNEVLDEMSDLEATIAKRAETALDSLRTKIAAVVVEQLHNSFRIRKGYEPVTFTYEVPQADYRAAQKTIEEKVNRQTPLKGYVSSIQVGLQLLSFTNAQKLEDGADVSFSVMVEQDKHILRINVWQQGITDRAGRERYKGIAISVYSIICDAAPQHPKN